ncbi:hypothetical protein SY83_19255 [Paenibacillus swuensis]|uniref:Mutants block sporulation after engulfment (Stage III sporulation) n=1 Tax=Paenibacillus swuensis TaxID=1178515 RepID=A0A172TMS6_9BACL|nr:SpoIIIAH-like family protein [Paenibacillus swuensis]ANE48073.1 hypothetical protein SY83_19255 [Paenibacillus swuensis]
MNTKRQTVWLVSMLSLMVVLSAYYLFTDTPGTTDLTATNNTTVKEVNLLDGTETVTKTETITKTETDSAVEVVETGKEEPATGTKEVTETSKNQAGEKETAVAPEEDLKLEELFQDEEAVLNMIETEAESGTGFFDTKVMERNEKLASEFERLNAVTVDMKKTPDEVSKAQNEIQQLEVKEDKLTELETEFMKEYENAVVLNDADKWTVVVQSEKLAAGEAVSILERVITELDIAPDKVSVQYMK